MVKQCVALSPHNREYLQFESVLVDHLVTNLSVMYSGFLQKTGICGESLTLN